MLLTLPLVAISSNCIIAQQNSKPNIVFIFADDLTMDGLGSQNKDVSTPNLDELKNEGVFFSHTFNQGAWGGAVSVASRSMLNTGKYLWKAASYNNSNKQFQNNGNWPEGVTPYASEKAQPGKHWGEYMKEAGYTTYFTGNGTFTLRRQNKHSIMLLMNVPECLIKLKNAMIGSF